MVNEGQQGSINRTIEHEDISRRCTGDEVVDCPQLKFRGRQHIWYAAPCIPVWKETHDIPRRGPQARAFVPLLVRHEDDILFAKVVLVYDSGHVVV